MNPRLITQRDLIRALPANWREQYPDGGYHGHKHVQALLDALDLELATPEQVAAIIGNDSWTTLNCDGCDQRKPWIVQVGAAPDWESATARLCGQCLAEAVKAGAMGGGE